MCVGIGPYKGPLFLYFFILYFDPNLHKITMCVIFPLYMTIIKYTVAILYILQRARNRWKVRKEVKTSQPLPFFQHLIPRSETKISSQTFPWPLPRLRGGQQSPSLPYFREPMSARTKAKKESTVFYFTSRLKP